MALIKCPECGKEISNKAHVCPNCGNPMDTSIYAENTHDNETNNEEYIFCPKCFSNQVHSEQRGFGGGKALVGAIAFGGIGLLAGTIGSKDVNITCLKCGYKFKAGNALTATLRERKEIEQELNDSIRIGGINAAKEYIQKRMNWKSVKSFSFVEAYMKGHPNIVQPKETVNKTDANLKVGCVVITFIIVIILFIIMFN